MSRLQGLGDQVTGWFFNPNIHPPQEARRREQALRAAAEAVGFPLLAGDHGAAPPDFLSALARGGRRCHTCYALRLEATAQQAASHGFEAFSTTLSVSPYQDLEVIRAAGEAAAQRHGVQFRFADLRADYPESCERARSLQLYRQRYCGCLFSALERAAARSTRALQRSLAEAMA